MRVRLEINSNDSAVLALGEEPAEKISGLKVEGIAFTGTSAGVIQAADALRHGAKTLRVKLIPYEGKLVGRILAEAGEPDSMPNVMLPYLLTLNRIPR